MPKKLAFEEVKKFVEENSECELLSTEYINQGTKMLFKCSCGNEFEATFNKFKNRNKRQCNKCGREKVEKSRRLTFKEVKRFVEVESNNDCELLSSEYLNENSNLRFRCSCGNEFEATFHNFKNNNKRQCNECGNKPKNEARKLTIQGVREFVKENSDCELLSTEYIGKKSKLRFRCNCGNEFERSFDNFKNSNQRQCDQCVGEIKLTIQDIKRFVEKNSNCILLSTEYHNNHTKLLLQCECGNAFETTFANFKGCNKRRCDECTKKISHPELKTSNLLKEYNINFIPQYKFCDCRYVLPLPFDFYLPDYNMCIEIDGQQHYKPIEKYGGKEALRFQQKRDKIKDIYCNDNNIKLVRIPYTEFDNIENILKSALL